MKHYKSDTFPWADTIGAAVFDWQELLHTDEANSYTYWKKFRPGCPIPGYLHTITDAMIFLYK